MRSRLEGLIDPATICRVFEEEYGLISWQDLEMLAEVEDYLKAEGPEETDG